MYLRPSSDSAREAQQLRLGTAIEEQVLPHYRLPFPRVPRLRLPAGRRGRIENPLYAIVEGCPLDYESYRAGVSSGSLPARAIHGPMHAARSALWTGLISVLRRRAGVEHGADMLVLQMAAAFHDAARQDEGEDAWQRESEELFEQWRRQAGFASSADFTAAERSILRDADVLEILRVLESPQHFQVGRLAIASIPQIAREQLDRFVNEVLAFIRISENSALKKDLEESGQLYLRLMHLIVHFDRGEDAFPLLHSLLRELAGQ